VRRLRLARKTGRSNATPLQEEPHPPPYYPPQSPISEKQKMGGGVKGICTAVLDLLGRGLYSFSNPGVKTPGYGDLKTCLLRYAWQSPPRGFGVSRSRWFQPTAVRREPNYEVKELPPPASPFKNRNGGDKQNALAQKITGRSIATPLLIVNFYMYKSRLLYVKYASATQTTMMPNEMSR